MEDYLAEGDAWICPVASVPAFKHRSPFRLNRAVSVDGRQLPYEMAASAYCTVFNLTGNPVVTIPVARSRDGLPIGMQLVGPRWRDMELLAIAEQLAADVTG